MGLNIFAQNVFSGIPNNGFLYGRNITDTEGATNYKIIYKNKRVYSVKQK